MVNQCQCLGIILTVNIGFWFVGEIAFLQVICMLLIFKIQFLFSQCLCVPKTPNLLLICKCFLIKYTILRVMTWKLITLGSQYRHCLKQIQFGQMLGCAIGDCEIDAISNWHTAAFSLSSSPSNASRLLTHIVNPHPMKHHVSIDDISSICHLNVVISIAPFSSMNFYWNSVQ